MTKGRRKKTRRRSPSGGGGGGGMMRSMRGGFRSAVGSVAPADANKNKGGIWNWILWALLAVAILYALQRFGVF